MRTVRLLSVEMVSAPGVLRAAIHYYAGGEKAKWRRVMMSWGLTRQCADDLLSKRIEWREEKNEQTGFSDVVFEYQDGKAFDREAADKELAGANG